MITGIVFLLILVSRACLDTGRSVPTMAGADHGPLLESALTMEAVHNRWSGPSASGSVPVTFEEALAGWQARQGR